MIKDMMAMKEISQQPQGVADNERKQKAEDLINRLLKGNFIWFCKWTFQESNIDKLLNLFSQQYTTL